MYSMIRMFNAHIKVEYCNSVKSIKYIRKYISKGSDKAIFGLEKDGETIDEVPQYQLGFPIHDRYPAAPEKSPGKWPTHLFHCYKSTRQYSNPFKDNSHRILSTVSRRRIC